MRQMIGVVKYTCDFCEFTITKPSALTTSLPAGWASIWIGNQQFEGRDLRDCCPQCKEKHADK